MLLPYYSPRKILFRPKLQKPQSFANRCLASCKGIGIPASGKFLRVESGILGHRIRSTAQGIRNPSNNWNPESKFHWKRSGTQYLESGIHGVESRILDCAWIPLHGGDVSVVERFDCSKIPTLSYTRSLKKVYPFQEEPPFIGNYRECLHPWELNPLLHHLLYTSQ